MLVIGHLLPTENRPYRCTCRQGQLVSLGTKSTQILSCATIPDQYLVLPLVQVYLCTCTTTYDSGPCHIYLCTPSHHAVVLLVSLHVLLFSSFLLVMVWLPLPHFLIKVRVVFYYFDVFCFFFSFSLRSSVGSFGTTC